MAIKGKKKSRGSQARRRPAAPPRPTASSSSRRVPWWKTTGGGAALVLALVGLASLIAYIVIDNQRDSDRLAERQETLGDYVDHVRSGIQTADVAASEMAQIQPGPEVDAETIGKDADRWADVFEKAQITISSVPPPPSLNVVNQLVVQSLALYGTTAKTYQIAPDVSGRAQTDLLTRAGEIRAQAVAAFTAAMQELDRALIAAELDPSGLPPPGSAPPPAPSPAPSPAPPEKKKGKGGNED